MKPSCVVGIDMGTSSVKVTLAGETGDILASAMEAYNYDRPRPGWCEIEPSRWMEAALKCLDTVLPQSPAPIRAISVTGQMHSTIFLDENGRSIRPAILWNDKRTTECVASLKKEIASRPSLRPIYSILSTGSPAANLLWLKRNEPESFAALRHFLIGPDFLVFLFTGVYGTDYCEASTSSLFDLHEKDWSKPMADSIGLKPSVYPPIHGSAVVAGQLRKEWMERYGLREPVVVLTGTGDNAAAAVATGCLHSGEPFLSLGTSAVLMIQKPSFDFSAKGKNILFSKDGKRFYHLCQGVVQACGNTVCWWQESILGLRMAELDKVNVRITSDSPLFYPHLNGEKTLYGDPSLTGGFLGLTLNTDKDAISVAVLEGICYAVKELMTRLCPNETIPCLKVIGGGARNAGWMQMMADILHCDIRTLDGSGDASYGAALLALPLGCEKQPTGKRFAPHEAQSAVYMQRYQRYLKFHDAIKCVQS